MNVFLFIGVWILATIFTGPFGFILWPVIYLLPSLLNKDPAQAND